VRLGGRNSSRAIGYARLAFGETALSRKIPQSVRMRELLAALPQPSSSPARLLLFTGQERRMLALRCRGIDPESTLEDRTAVRVATEVPQGVCWLECRGWELPWSAPFSLLLDLAEAFVGVGSNDSWRRCRYSP
jgi:hypothetical protein